MLATISVLSAFIAARSYFDMREAGIQNVSVNFGGIAALFFAVIMFLTGAAAICLIRQRK